LALTARAIALDEINLAFVGVFSEQSESLPGKRSTFERVLALHQIGGFARASRALLPP
jgi:uncharacterized membrane protein YidH (DUF202 family)